MRKKWRAGRGGAGGFTEGNLTEGNQGNEENITVF
jgi:hypothetical protein